MSKLLSPERVTQVFMGSLFTPGENTDDAIVARGIVTNVGFNRERLEQQRDAIVEMLNELPLPFRASSGGGWSFVNACLDKNGDQWTGLHSVMEQLFLLGLAIDKVK